MYDQNILIRKIASANSLEFKKQSCLFYFTNIFSHIIILLLLCVLKILEKFTLTTLYNGFWPLLH